MPLLSGRATARCGTFAPADSGTDSYPMFLCACYTMPGTGGVSHIILFEVWCYAAPFPRLLLGSTTAVPSQRQSTQLREGLTRSRRIQSPLLSIRGVTGVRFRCIETEPEQQGAGWGRA
eukprot:1407913-Rhodomonas_salina.2